MCKPVSVIQHIVRLKGRNHRIILIDAEKACDEVQHPFVIKKVSEKLGEEKTKTNLHWTAVQCCDAQLVKM